MAKFKVPTELDVKSILGMLFEGVKVAPAKERDLSASDGYVGIYVDDEGKPVTACLCDVEFAAYAACSLTMLPPPVAQESVNSGKLEKNMLDNLGEVFNILSRLFLTNDTDHLKFHETHEAQSLPADISESLGQASKLVSFEISFPRYGEGILTMLVTQ